MPSPDPLRRSFVDLFQEQVRAVALALSREGMFAGAALALICLFSLIMSARYGEELDLEPSLLDPICLGALLMPFAVWKNDPVFGRAFLWTLPVRRQEAVLAKLLAGAAWLMIAIAVAMAALACVALVSGGTVGTTETRYLLAGPGGVADAARVRWSTPFWAWLLPFTNALWFYLLGSAALLGLRHPIRWVFGSGIALFLAIMLVVSVAPHGAFEHAVDQLAESLWASRFGLGFALTEGGSSLARVVDRPGPGFDLIWSRMPEFGQWAMATGLWISAAALAVALAIRRHWER